jgi:outer membrane cobalamin receptor
MIIILFWSLLSIISFAQQTDSTKKLTLEEVVITANKFSVQKISSDSKIEILLSEEIENVNGNRLSNILNLSSSVNLKSYGIAPHLQTISMNGLAASHSLIIIDGIKLNSTQNGQFDLSLIPKDLISRIEIINGGSSAIYGSEAISGVVNIVTKKISENKNEKLTKLNASYSTGSFNTIRYAFSGLAKFNSLTVDAFFAKEKSDGNFQYYFTDGNSRQLKQRENANYNIYDLGISSTYLYGRTIFSYLTYYSYQDKQIPSIEVGNQPSNSKQLDKNWNNIFTFKSEFSESFFFDLKLNYINNLLYYLNLPFINSNYHNVSFSINPELSYKYDDNNITAGYSYYKGKINSNELERNAFRNHNSAYLYSKFKPVDPISFFSSIRVDNYSDIQVSPFTYKFGFNYKPLKNIDFSIKANIGTNFKAPTFNDLYWKESGNKNLRPEKSQNVEAGFVFQFNYPLLFSFEFNYIHIELIDKIIWLPQRNLLWKPINIDASVSNSFSFDITTNHRIFDSTYLSMKLISNFNQSKKTSSTFQGDPSTNKFLPNSPLQTIKINLTLKDQKKGINLFYNHLGKRYSDFENLKLMKTINTIDGNIFFNFQFYDLKTKLVFEINNITNTDYQIISGYPMPLKNYSFIISINY